MKKIYYFTIATNTEYFEYATFLKKSMDRFGINLNIRTLVKTNDLLKCRLEKINGIREIPEGFERVFYIDADCIMHNFGIPSNINGMLLEEVLHKREKYIPKNLTFEHSNKIYKNLNHLLDISNLSELKLESGGYGMYEWNGGVLSGDLKFANELADEWEKWIYKIIEIHEGQFLRDQIALKYAYYNIGLKRYSYRTIPKEWNWGIKWWGINKSAFILHEAGWVQKNKNNWRELL